MTSASDPQKKSTEIQAQRQLLNLIYKVLLILGAAYMVASMFLTHNQLIYNLMIALITMGSLFVLAVLNKKGYYRTASSGTLLSISISIFLLTYLQLKNTGDFSYINYYLIPVTLSSILLPLKGSLIFSSVLVISIFILPAFLSGDSIQYKIFSHGLFITLITAVIQISTWQRESIERARRKDLQNQEKRFKNIIEKSNDITLIMSREGKYTYLSPSVKTIMGYDTSFFLGKKPGNLVHPDDVPEFGEAFQSFVENPDELRHLGNIRIRYADESWHWFDLMITPMFDVRGIDGAVINGRDITEHKKIELQLSEHMEKYRLLTENTSDVVFICDSDLKLRYISPSAEKLFGYTIAELMEMTLDKVMTPESFAESIREFGYYLNKIQDGEMDVPLLEHEHIRKDGSTFWGEMRSTFVYDNHGKIISQGIIRDITERKFAEKEQRRLEEELRQSEKLSLIGQLAGGVAHDFNNHLTAILAYADMVANDYEAVPRIKEYAEAIVTASNRSADLIGKLLAFARKGKLHSVPVNVHILLEEVIMILEHSIDKRILIKRHFEASPDITIGDPTQLENAILNLTLNARDAMPGGGELRLSTSIVKLDENFKNTCGFLTSPGTYIKISVSDTGTGMDSFTLARIFEPFFTTKGQGKGTGMGLPAVYGTVKSHLGAISVESEPDKGTNFHLYFPVAKNENIIEQTVTQALQSSYPSNGSKRILIVDDETFICKMASMVLKRHDYEVVMKNDPQIALELFCDNKGMFDLVILDIIMPGMSGIELFFKMQKINPYIRALFTSGYALDKDLKEVIEQSRCDFLPKPYNTGELADKVMSILK